MIKRVDIQVVDLENIDVERKPIVDAFTRYETLAKMLYGKLFADLRQTKRESFVLNRKIYKHL